MYLGKATILSGFLYTYYHLALKDKQTFGWNRFYLLAATGLSLVVPLLNIPIHLSFAGQQEAALVHILNVTPGVGEDLSDGRGLPGLLRLFPGPPRCCWRIPGSCFCSWRVSCIRF
jgi:hypothetical protein